MHRVKKEVALLYHSSGRPGKIEVIPTKPLDPRLISYIAPAVARAAIKSGVAKYPISDRDAYKISLDKRLSENIKKIGQCSVD
jgi:malate dehydrogenase (oxaloacetate-decarboxylating)(NADP+)